MSSATSNLADISPRPSPDAEEPAGPERSPTHDAVGVHVAEKDAKRDLGGKVNFYMQSSAGRDCPTMRSLPRPTEYDEFASFIEARLARLNEEKASAAEKSQALRVAWQQFCSVREARAKLMVAIRLGDVASVRTALSQIDDVNFLLDGISPLGQAAASNQVDIIDLLLEKNADPELRCLVMPVPT